MTDLTPAQLAAVTHPGGPLLVIAGAGTGKTHTLVERFAWLAEGGTPPEAVLALTYSTAAADDLRCCSCLNTAVRATELA